MKNTLQLAALALALSTVNAQLSTALAQGSLTPPPGPPAPTQKTLQQIWDKIGVLETQNAALLTQNQTLAGQVNALAQAAGVSSWNITTVDTGGGHGCSLRLSPSGQPAMSYYKGFREVRYASFNGTSWVSELIELVASTNFVGSSRTALAFSQSGAPAVAYHYRQSYWIIPDVLYDYYNRVNFAFPFLGQWVTQPITTVGDRGYFLSLVLKTNDQPLICYSTHDNEVESWDPTLGFRTVSTGQYPSLALSPTGEPTVAYSGSGLDSAILSGGNWQGRSSLVNGGHRYISLAFHSNGTPGISCSETNQHDRLVYLVRNGTQLFAPWGTSVADPDATVSGPTSLAYTPAGQPAIAYYDSAAPALKYATLGTNGRWTITSVAVGSSYDSPSLIFTAQGLPAIGYYDNFSDSLKYAVLNPQGTP